MNNYLSSFETQAHYSSVLSKPTEAWVFILFRKSRSRTPKHDPDRLLGRILSGDLACVACGVARSTERREKSWAVRHCPFNAGRSGLHVKGEMFVVAASEPTKIRLHGDLSFSTNATITGKDENTCRQVSFERGLASFLGFLVRPSETSDSTRFI